MTAFEGAVRRIGDVLIPIRTGIEELVPLRSVIEALRFLRLLLLSLSLCTGQPRGCLTSALGIYLS